MSLSAWRGAADIIAEKRWRRIVSICDGYDLSGFCI